MVVAYKILMDKISRAQWEFWKEVGIKPNRIVLSKDLHSLLLKNAEKLLFRDMTERGIILSMQIDVDYERTSYMAIGYIKEINNGLE